MGAWTIFKGPESTYNLSIAFIAVILISIPLQGIAEEYAFRGFFMQTLGSWFKIPVLALVLQAIVFTRGHQYNSFGLFETLVSGLGYGFFAWKTNGIEVSSALTLQIIFPLAYLSCLVYNHQLPLRNYWMLQYQSFF